MSREPGRGRERFLEMVEKFRQKGATSPDKAMTPEELGLPLRFRYLMVRRLGKLGVFLEKDGRYYLSEERLAQLEQQRSVWGTARHSRRTLLTLGIVRMVIVILFISLILVNWLVQSLEIKIVSSILLIALLGISVLQLYYLTKARASLLNP